MSETDTDNADKVALILTYVPQIMEDLQGVEIDADAARALFELLLD